jgi:hypothetical protein
MHSTSNQPATDSPLGASSNAGIDLDALADTTFYLQMALSDWRLPEYADYQADFYRHAGHDPEETRRKVYENARKAVAQLFPPAFPLPDIDWFMDGHGLPELVRDGLRNICAISGDTIALTVACGPESTTTIEATLDECRCAIAPEAPLPIINTSKPGIRVEHAVLTPEHADAYERLASLLDEAADAIAAHSDDA